MSTPTPGPLRPALRALGLALLLVGGCSRETGAGDTDTDPIDDDSGSGDGPWSDSGKDSADPGDTADSGDTSGPPGDPAVTQAPGFDSDVFRQWPGIVQLDDGRVLVAGGQIVRGPDGGGPGRVTGREETELLDVGKQTFALTGALQDGRYAMGATLLADGSVLVTGGAGGPAGDPAMPRATAERFVPAQGTWTRLTATMVEARAGHLAWVPASGTFAGQVLLLGGQGPPYTAERYDPGDGDFHAVPVSGAPAKRTSAYVLLADGRVLLVGVWDDADDPTQCWFFAPETGTFTRTGDLTTERTGFSATLLADGRVLVAGGVIGTTYLDSAEIFDPSTGTSTALSATLGSPRYGHAAARLGSGRVVLAGGVRKAGEALATVDVFDPATGTFSQADGELAAARASASGFALADGRVMILGGQAILPHSGTAILSTVDFIGE
ncbi:MAG: hypothetical protein H6732_06750 [Alphaproteobacteria bacterium]|nr:hypothetical protein [Alphaproteobacteria bacterium]